MAAKRRHDWRCGGRFAKKPKTECPGIFNKHWSDDVVKRVRRRRTWIASALQLSAERLQEADGGAHRTQCGNNLSGNLELCSDCNGIHQLLLLFALEHVQLLDKLLIERGSDFSTLHIQLDSDLKCLQLTNVNRVVCNPNFALITARLDSQQLVIHKHPNQQLYQSRIGNVLSLKALHLQLQRYLADSVILCGGFVSEPHISAAEHSNSFRNALFLPNGLIRSSKCIGLVEAKGSKCGNLCHPCLVLQQKTKTAKCVQIGYQPAKGASYDQLPTSIRRSIHKQQTSKLQSLESLCQRLKRRLEKIDQIVIEHEETNRELYALHKYINDNFESLSAALKIKPLLCAFLKDQLKSAIQDNKPSSHSSKGMRWSQATYQLAIHLACASGSKIMERTNRMNMIKLPSDQMIKFRRFDVQHGQGVTKNMVKDLAESLREHRVQSENGGDPYLVMKFDEIYVKRGIVYNPAQNRIIGITTELESNNYLQPIYDFADAVQQDRNVDASALDQYTAKVAVQVIFSDLSSKFNFVGPFWFFHKNATAEALWKCFVMDLLFAMWLIGVVIKVLMSDMSSTNLSFVQLLSGGRTCKELINEPILVQIPFYVHQVVYMFVPHHNLKALRNALYKSTADDLNVIHQTFPLQNLYQRITWEHITMLFNADIDLTSGRCRTLTKAAVYLTPWSKQSVGLALNVFHENVVSALEYHVQQGNDPDVKGTLDYIKMTRQFLVGTFVSPAQADGQYDKLRGIDNPLLPRLKTAWNWFHIFQELNPHSNLSIRTYLAASSIWYGFEWIVSDFSAMYSDMEEDEQPYLCPYRLTTNDCEMFFGQQRGRNADRVGTYDKGVGLKRLMQQNQLQTEHSNTGNSNSKIRSQSLARQRNRAKKN